MNKRAIAILGAIFILIVATLGFLIYLRSRSSSNTNTNTAVVDPTQQPPPVAETPPETPTAPAASGAVRLTDEPVVSPILFFKGTGISYFNSQGQLFQTDLQDTNGAALLSNKKELSIALKPNISKILWPVSGKNFMAEFSSNNKPTWSFYDGTKAAYTDVPTQVYSLDWMPAGDKIIFTWVDNNGKGSLNIGNPDASGYKVLSDLYESDDAVSVSPDGKNILLYRLQNPDTTKNTISMVGTDGKNFKTVVADGYNTGVLWSPDSKKFLFTRRDPGTQKFNLWVADVATGQTVSLGVATSVTKAVWSQDSQTVYAGVPTADVSSGSLTQDKIYVITASTGESKQLDPGITVDVENLFLNKAENILFFKNAQDNFLYYIPVK